jgi:2-O-methyltransferase
MKVMKHYKAKFDLLKKIIKKENPVVVEIGAHYGEDSLRFLESFPEITLYCFEPDPRNIKMFKKYIDDDRVTLFESALSSENGTAEFYQSYQDNNEAPTPPKYDWIDSETYENEKLNNSGSSSLKKGYEFTIDKSITVITQKYADWALENNVEAVDFVWMDVQGAEKEVLDGMGDTIRNVELFWMEYGETTYEGAMTREETANYMSSRGFALVEKLSSQGSAGDLLFLRKENV